MSDQALACASVSPSWQLALVALAQSSGSSHSALTRVYVV
jgi:hypothetical protein